MAKGIAEMLAAKAAPMPGPMEGEEGEENPEGDEMGLEAAADELIKGMHARDPKMVADALKNFFAIAESEPHEEGPHTGEAPTE